MKNSRTISAALFALSLLLLWESPLHAATPNNLLDNVVIMYRDASAGWREPIQAAAVRLFWLLALIDLAWTSTELALKQAGIQDVFSSLIRWVMTTGFFLALLTFSNTWGAALINSFRQLGAAASTRIPGATPGLDPSDIFDLGLRLSSDMVRSLSFADPGDSLIRSVTGLLMMLLFSALAAFVLIAIVEMYVVLNASIILLGFGGSRFTSDYSRKYYAHVVSVGLKLFAMQLLVGLGQAFIMRFYSGYTGTMTEAFAICGATLILVLITMTIPAMMQSIVTGASHGGAGAAAVSAGVTTAGMAAAAATGGLGSVVAGGKAISEAAKLASSQGAASGNQGLGSLASGTLKNLASAGLSDLGERMSGNINHQHGRAGARMASQLKEERLSSRPPKKEGGSAPVYADSGKGAETTNAAAKATNFSKWR